ncbi:transposase [Methanothrix thermoacetophila PT]|uniref:Transposase n=2 Tax=Methanothrix TaxID=2222 RepID=A0B7T1_METTP|nr:transposase [Methanothrix thermoacetophila PT]
MEDVLDVYEQPYDPKRPVICFDERTCQLLGDTIVPIPMKPGSPRKEHYEYERNGTCCVFMAFEPLAGRGIVSVRERRTKIDYAEFMVDLANQYPDAEKIIVVQDNLNTHTMGSFYDAMPPDDAFKLAKQFEFNYTPKKGSWLNMAEIELSALSKQCLDRRIPDINKLRDEINIWQQERNAIRATVQWKFSKDNARAKLKRHYNTVKN